ncbi:MAG TPA: hypothetical protein VIK14_02220 [Ignavibacteria bacterium]
MITVPEFITYMNIPVPVSDDLTNLIKDCILASVDDMNTFTNRRLVEMNPSHDMSIIITTKIEYYDGYDSNIIYTKNYPVVELDPESRSVLQYLKNDESWEDIIKPPDTISNSLLILDFGKIRLLKNYKFPAGVKNIKITYKSGYDNATLPGDLKRVCYEKSGLKFLNSACGNFQRLGLESYEISNQIMRLTNMYTSHNEVLKKYRRPVI